MTTVPDSEQSKANVTLSNLMEFHFYEDLVLTASHSLMKAPKLQLQFVEISEGNAAPDSCESM